MINRKGVDSSDFAVQENRPQDTVSQLRWGPIENDLLATGWDGAVRKKFVVL